MSKLSIFTKGIVKENPVLVLILGICPVLAVSTQATNAVGLGLATTFVLLGANIVISLLRNVIPTKVRIPCYIVLISGLVALVQMIVEAYAFELHLALGIFLPLIACNCVIFARAEIFANKNTVGNSIIDALGIGLGFTLAILAIASIREAFGAGTLFGFDLPGLSYVNIPILTLAPGGFIVFGCLIALVNKISKGTAIKKKEFGCDNCPSALVCGKGGAK
ncbi:MAG: electron transport complex subunit E [Oscillospiraceae bacterium]|nr:electron transport complex subunit E [Oscillospiraceae bacterium]